MDTRTELETRLADATGAELDMEQVAMLIQAMAIHPDLKPLFDAAYEQERAAFEEALGR